MSAKNFNLVMTLLVRDEEDIIAANLDFHLAQGVDFFIVMDNLSTDRTAAELIPYQDRGLLHYILQEDDSFDKRSWVTMMARLAFERYGTKWVINNDADEFWWPLAQSTLRDTLLGLPKHCQVVRAQRHNFTPITGATGRFYEEMIYREKTSLNPLGQPLPPKVCHRGSKDVIVRPGSHAVEGISTTGICTNAIEILHYPIRNLQQYENKIINGGRAYRRNRTAPQFVGEAWRRLYAHYEKHGHLPESTVSQIRTPEQIAQAVERGELIEDRRMLDFMTRLNHVQPMTAP